MAGCRSCGTGLVLDARKWRELEQVRKGSEKLPDAESQEAWCLQVTGTAQLGGIVCCLL